LSDEIIDDSKMKFIDSFIEKIHARELEINANASQISYTVVKDTSYRKESLADKLSESIYRYETTKNIQRSNVEEARTCLFWIERAYTCNVVNEGQGFTNKLNKLQERITQLENANKQLQEENNKLQEQYFKLKKEYDKLKRNTLPKSGRRALGDVVGR